MVATRMPGPVVPGFTQLVTALSPVRLYFDSLSYIAENAAKYGGLYAIYLGDQVTYVICDPKLVHEVLVTRNAEFHKAPILKKSVGELLGNGLLTSEGDFWKRQRKLAQPAFHPQRIATYSNTMVEQTLAHLAHWQVGETRDIAQDMMALTLGIVNKTLFNIDMTAKAAEIGKLTYILLEAANDRLNSYEPIWEKLFKTRRRRELQATQALFKIIDDIIAQHGAADTGDLLSMLLAARDDEGNPMDAKQLRDEVMTLFVAGHETTANALDWAFYLLAQNPAAANTLQAEIATLNGQPPTMADLARLPYSELVIKEALRLYPPASGAARTPIHDIELGGYLIPKGSNIALSIYAMQRNPALFPEPLKFDPDRFSPAREASIIKYSYLPFGAGPRVCIGNSFAMMEARLILITVLQRFRLELTGKQPVQAEQLFTTRPRGGLKMLVQARS
jgi:cytochrome P450